MQDYISGNWEEARISFELSMKIKGSKDFPALKIIEFMEHLRYEPPSNWEGKRDFESGH